MLVFLENHTYLWVFVGIKYVVRDGRAATVPCRRESYWRCIMAMLSQSVRRR